MYKFVSFRHNAHARLTDRRTDRKAFAIPFVALYAVARYKCGNYDALQLKAAGRRASPHPLLRPCQPGLKSINLSAAILYPFYC